MRAIFPDDDAATVDALLNRYYGTVRDAETSRNEAVPSNPSEQERLAHRLLVELQERHKLQNMLGTDEVAMVEQALNPPAPANPVQLAPTRRGLRFAPDRRQVLVLLAALLAAVIAVLGVRYINYTYDSGTPVEPRVGQPALPPVEQQPEAQSSREKMLELYGPWETIAPSGTSPDTNHPALLVLNQNGSTIASQQWQVPTSLSTWRLESPILVTNVSVKGSYVVLQSSRGLQYIVHVGQAFIFEQTPGKVFFVDEAGRVLTTDLEQATAGRLPLR